VALDCFTEKGASNGQEEIFRSECQRIIRADNLFNELNFHKALSFYSELTDSFARAQKECNRLFCISQIKAEELDRLGKYKEAVQVQREAKMCNFSNKVSQSREKTINGLMQKILNKNNDKNKAKLEWEGVWYQKQSGKKEPILGTINITFDEKFARASFVDQFANNVQQSGELTQLTFEENDTKLSGIWRNDSTKYSGKFSLKKSSTTSFEGYYTMPSDDKQFSWKGSKSKSNE
jgi:hypothetical protein